MKHASASPRASWAGHELGTRDLMYVTLPRTFAASPSIDCEIQLMLSSSQSALQELAGSDCQFLNEARSTTQLAANHQCSGVLTAINPFDF